MKSMHAQFWGGVAREVARRLSKLPSFRGGQSLKPCEEKLRDSEEKPQKELQPCASEVSVWAVSAAVAGAYIVYLAITAVFLVISPPECSIGEGSTVLGGDPSPAADGVSVFYAISIPASATALVVALQFNRPLLHNRDWHFWVSMKWMVVAVLASLVPYLLSEGYSPSFCVCLVLAGALGAVQGLKLVHPLLPSRGHRIGRGSPAEFTNAIRSVRMPWSHAACVGAILFCVAVTWLKYGPTILGPLAPVLMILLESTVLGLFCTRHTPEHFLISTGVVNAFVTVYWVVTPLCLAPRVTIPAFAISQPVCEDVVERYVVRRPDILWASDHVAMHPLRWAVLVALGYAVEASGIPFITQFFVPVFALSMISGALLFFFIPSAHILLARKQEAHSG